ncbi:15-hydroxyprostaglandin dehydrogenase [Trichonephila clavipes]|uniref:15-hydroxyprostaglandin dehydrogenase n=1 Tax=Trichonephila clavipes TaxID=2585209 RepID=A0A8X6WAW4_TRICX|nr:15-hydroxyprostaglandin dehydrogenase [Trichonephila clavipes]
MSLRISHTSMACQVTGPLANKASLRHAWKAAAVVPEHSLINCPVAKRVGPPPAATIHAATRSGIELIRHLSCPEADGPTNLEQPTLNHVQSDTMASAILADPTRAVQGTNWRSRPAMEESENDVGSLEQLLLYADEHYLAGKLPLGDHLGKVLHGVEEYHQRNVGPLRFPASQLKWTVYHRL